MADRRGPHPRLQLTTSAHVKVLVLHLGVFRRLSLVPFCRLDWEVSVPLLNRKQMGWSTSWCHFAVVCACCMKIHSSFIFYHLGNVRKSIWRLSYTPVCAKVINLYFISVWRALQSNTEITQSFPTGLNLQRKGGCRVTKRITFYYCFWKSSCCHQLDSFLHIAVTWNFPNQKKR